MITLSRLKAIKAITEHSQELAKRKGLNMNNWMIRLTVITLSRLKAIKAIKAITDHCSRVSQEKGRKSE
jgi:hypothetical protein